MEWEQKYILAIVSAYSLINLNTKNYELIKFE